jgi:hypothetical protein
MQIKPYKSVGTIMFGQSRAATIEQLGMPKSKRFNRENVEELEYEKVIVRLNPDNDQVIEITLLPFTAASISEIELTWDMKFLETACQLDGQPLDVFGFIVLPNLGIAVTGIHDADDSQLAVTVFKEGAFDELIKAAAPYSQLNH